MSNNVFSQLYLLTAEHHLKHGWTKTSGKTHQRAKLIVVSHGHAIRKSLVQEAEIVVAYTQALKDHESPFLDHNVEEIGIENEELSLESEWAQRTEYSTQQFSTHWEVQALFAEEVESLVQP